MKRSDALALKPGDKIQLKSSRSKFKYSFDKEDKGLIPGEELVVRQVDPSMYTGLTVLAYRNGIESDCSWVNHHSIKKVKVQDELPSSS